MRNPDVDNSKFYPPQIFGSIQRRQSVNKKIDRAKAHGMLYVTAPIGYGKTTAIADWLKYTGYKCAWLTVDSYDADESVFCRDIVLALARGARQNKKLANIISGPGFFTMPLECAYYAFDSIEPGKDPFVIVLDDFHMAENEQILRILGIMRSRLPANVFIIIISRSMPSKALDELIRKSDSFMLKIDDLRFTAMDIQDLLNSKGVSIDDDEADAIVKKTEGWAAAISLIAQNYYEYAPKSKTSQKFINDFIKIQIFNKLDVSRRMFHIQVSIARIVDPAFCTYITGAADSKAYLEELADKTGFIVRFADDAYRYHQLFRDTLLTLLDESPDIDKHALYRKAAQWAYDNRRYLEAIDYYTAIGENKLAEDIVRELTITQTTSLSVGEYAVNMKRILVERIPEEEIIKNPLLVMDCAWIAYLDGDLPGLQYWLNVLQGLRDNNQIIDRNDRIASQFMFLLNPSDSIWDIINRFDKDFAIVDDSKDYAFPAMSISQNLPFFHKSQRDYSEVANRLDTFFDEFRTLLEPVLGPMYEIMEDAVSAGIYYEKRQIRRALELMEHARGCLNDHIPPELHFCVYMILSEIYEAMNMKQEADGCLKAAEQMITRTNALYLLPNLRMVLTVKNLMIGKKEAARDWLDNYAPKVHDNITLYQYMHHIVTARCLIATARFKEAIALLTQLEAFCESYNRVLDGISIRALLAIAYWDANNKDAAIECLEEGLIKAQQYGYISVFAQEGSDIWPLLKKISNRVSRGISPHIDKGYVKSILIHTKNCEIRNSGMGMTVLSGVGPKKLSKQQKRMLEYLADGMSYLEICQETGLKITSVREHITKMYEKLSVHNSTDAILKAKELGLLNEESASY